MIKLFLCLFLMLVLTAGCGDGLTGPDLESAQGKRYYEPMHLVVVIPELMQEAENMPDTIFYQLSDFREDMGDLSPEELRVQEQLDALAVEISNMEPSDKEAVRQNLKKMMEIAKENADPNA